MPFRATARLIRPHPKLFCHLAAFVFEGMAEKSPDALFVTQRPPGSAPKIAKADNEKFCFVTLFVLVI
jgi:hypothetical protein